MSDTDSRVMPNKEGGYAPNYTPTAVTDGERGFILDVDVLNRVNEWRWAATAFNIIKLVRELGTMRAEFAQMATMPT